MPPVALSPTITSSRIDESRAFYQTHFAARILFDCGWYLLMRLGPEGAPEIGFMAPRGAAPAFAGGLTVNLLFDDVDAEHARLSAAGLPMVMPLEDHSWGDRGFCTLDPNGIALYCYTPIEPADEFKQYFKE